MGARRRSNPIRRDASNEKVGIHPADILARLRKAGWSLRGLSIHYGYHPSTLKTALRRPYPRAEKIIAMAIGLRADEIWPERYRRKGRRA